MKRILPVLILLICACENEEPVKEPVKPKVEETTTPSDEITYRLIYKENTGWGYQVFKGAKMLINQEHIPAVQGVKGFDTEEQAETTVKHLIERIKKGDPRPTLSVQELDSLGVI